MYTASGRQNLNKMRFLLIVILLSCQCLVAKSIFKFPRFQFPKLKRIQLPIILSRIIQGKERDFVQPNTEHFDQPKLEDILSSFKEKKVDNGVNHEFIIENVQPEKFTEKDVKIFTKEELKTFELKMGFEFAKKIDQYDLSLEKNNHKEDEVNRISNHEERKNPFVENLRKKIFPFKGDLY